MIGRWIRTAQAGMPADLRADALRDRVAVGSARVRYAMVVMIPRRAGAARAWMLTDVAADAAARDRVARGDADLRDSVAQRIVELERDMLDGPQDRPPSLLPASLECTLSTRTAGSDDPLAYVLRALEANAALMPARATPADALNDPKRTEEVAKARSAVEAYRGLVSDLAAALERRRGARISPSAQDQDFLATLLTLARVNLAEGMAAIGDANDKIQQAFNEAVGVGAQPALTNAYSRLADWHLRQKRWDDARRALASAAAAEPGEDTGATRNANRARLADAKAQALQSEGKYGDAEVELRAALGNVTDVIPPGWRGELRYTLAACLIAQSRDDDAVEQLAFAAKDYAEVGEFDTSELQAGVLARLGLLRLHLGDAKRGADDLDCSRKMVPPTKDWPNPDVRIVGRDLSDMIDKREDLAATLKAHITRQLRGARDPARRRDLINALRLLLDRSAALASEDSETVWRTGADGKTVVRNVVAQIRVTIPPSLVSGIKDANDVVIAALKGLRDGVRQEYGVLLPGVSVRDAAELEKTATFALEIDEVERARPQVVPGDFAETARRLGAMLPAYFGDLVGHQDVRALLAEERIAFETHSHMAPLTRLVRALVAQRVPVGDFARIHHLFQDALGRGDTTEAVAARIRLGRRERLWGNERQHALPLPPDWIKFLDPAKVVDGMLPVASAELAGLAKSVGDRLRDSGNSTTLVVEDHARRPLVRAALDSDPELAKVPVLALAELRPELLAMLPPDRAERVP